MLTTIYHNVLVKVTMHFLIPWKFLKDLKWFSKNAMKAYPEKYHLQLSC